MFGCADVIYRKHNRNSFDSIQDTKLFGWASEIVGPIIEDIPADPMNLEDMVHAELFHGRPEKALEYAAQLDPWLSSHLADLMNALSLIDSETDDE